MEQGTLFEVKKKPPVLSYSKLDSFLKCPFRYEKQYIKKISSMRIETRYHFGSNLHQALAKYLNPNKKSILFQKEDFSKDLKNYWFSDIYENERDSREAFERALNMIDNLSGSSYFKRLPKVVETRFRVPLDTAVLMGSIDRIDVFDETIEVIDYKSGDKESSIEDMKENFQWYFYYHGCKKILGKYPDKMTFIHFDTGRIVSFDIRNEDVGRMDIQFRKAVAGLLSEKDFKPTPNMWCTNCRFDRECGLIAKK